MLAPCCHLAGRVELLPKVENGSDSDGLKKPEGARIGLEFGACPVRVVTDLHRTCPLALGELSSFCSRLTISESSLTESCAQTASRSM